MSPDKPLLTWQTALNLTNCFKLDKQYYIKNRKRGLPNEKKILTLLNSICEKGIHIIMPFEISIAYVVHCWQ